MSAAATGPAGADAYDLIDYPSGPLPQAHPNRLATLATLFGMTPAPVENCRVLELGGGDGGHLIPCAFGLPQSRFLGIDRAEAPIRRARQTAAKLGLTNVAFECADLMEFPLEGEPFDYILAHGVYSWVPDAVRDRILAVCKARLAPQGVAYVSYNCYPGCYIRRMFWEILRFHVREFDEPGRKIEQAQAMAKFLAAGAPRGEDYSEFLHKELEALAERKHANVLYHDDLSEVNDPVYFHEFAARAAAHGLQYLAEADFFEMQDRIYPPQVREVLRGLGERDIILKEQYLDFLKLRRFRQTLLCHQGVPLDRDLKPARAREFRVLSAARATSPQPNLAAGAVEEFAGPRGGAMKLDHPLSKAALLVLADVFPHSLTYPELLARARQRLDADAAARESLKDSDPERDEEILTEVLLATYLADVTRWQVYQPEWPMALGEKPRLSPVARLELENGESVVTTLNFGVVSVEEAFDRQVLLLADGSRSPDDIAGEMGAKVRAGEVRVPAVAGEGGAPVTPEVPEAVRRSLEKAARYGLFAA